MTKATAETMSKIDLLEIEQRVKSIYRSDCVPVPLNFFEELIYRIIRFRRRHDTAGDWQTFELLVTDNAQRLNELNGRWLVSITDTFVDFGGEDYSKSLALLPAFMHFVEQVHSERYRGAGQGYATINKAPDYNTFDHLYDRISACSDITGVITKLVINKIRSDPDSLLGNYLNKAQDEFDKK